MTNSSSEMVFLIFWAGYAILALLALIPIVVWAINSGQFCNQDHARSLPLQSEIPSDTSISSTVSTPSMYPQTPPRTNGSNGHVSP